MSKRSGYYYMKDKVARLENVLEQKNAKIRSLEADAAQGWHAAKSYWHHMGWFRRWLWYRTHK